MNRKAVAVILKSYMYDKIIVEFRYETVLQFRVHIYIEKLNIK